MRDPRWWSPAHDEAWRRVRPSLRDGWEDDARRAARELGIDAAHEPTRGAARALPEPRNMDVDRAALVPDDDFEPVPFELVEPLLRFGAGGAAQYPEHATWTYELEARLRRDFGEANGEERWPEVEGAVRRGFESAQAAKSAGRPGGAARR